MKTRHQLVDLLSDPVYLRVWLVGACSGIARWLEMLVVGVFAFEVTGSPFLVALLLILRTIPLAAFGPIVGTFADRLPKRHFLCAGLALATLVSAIQCLLFLVGVVEYWHVAVATFASGIVWTMDMPLRRPMLGDVAGKERVAAAMSLDSATLNATRMLGPILGGLLYGWLGAGAAFMLTSALYGLSAALIFGVPAAVSSATLARQSAKFLGDFREVFHLIARDLDMLRILLVTLVINIWGFPFVSMIPVIGSDELALGAGGIGGLAAMEGAGSLLGALIIAARIRTTRFRHLYYFGTLSYLLLIVAAGSIADALPMATALFCAGLAVAGFTTMQTTLIYTVAPPEMRGRLFGVLVLCIGTGLIGHVNVGLMGEWFGGSAAIRIIAAEGIVPLLLIGIGWRQLWDGSELQQLR